MSSAPSTISPNTSQTQKGLTHYKNAVELALERTRDTALTTRWSRSRQEDSPSQPLPTDPAWAGRSLHEQVSERQVDADVETLWQVLSRSAPSTTGGASSTSISPGCCGCARMFHCRAAFGSSCRCVPRASVVAAIGNGWCSSHMVLLVKSFGRRPVGFVARCSAVSRATSPQRQTAQRFPRERSGRTDHGVLARS